MVQMSGYIKKQQEEDTKDLATLPVFELAIYMIRGESWVVLIPIVHYGSSEWKKIYEPFSDLKYNKITFVNLQNALGYIWLRY